MGHKSVVDTQERRKEGRVTRFAALVHKEATRLSRRKTATAKLWGPRFHPITSSVVTCEHNGAYLLTGGVCVFAHEDARAAAVLTARSWPQLREASRSGPP